MVSINAPVNEEHSICLKTKNNQTQISSNDKDVKSKKVRREPLDMECTENVATEIGCSEHPVAPSPPKASKTELAASPRASLARTRRQPPRFKDFDSGSLTKSPKKKRSLDLSSKKSEDLINNNIAVKNVKVDEKKAPPKSPQKKTPKGSSKKVLEVTKTAAQPSKNLPEKSSVVKEENSKNLPDAFEEGSLLWAKVFAHPYWPCMVCPDPETGFCYKKISDGNRKSIESGQNSTDEAYSYHVRFFGPKHQRCYTNPKVTERFEGGQKYLDRLEEMLAAANVEPANQPSKKKKKISSKMVAITKQYGIKSQARKAWDVAVKEADEVSLLSVEERKKKYDFFRLPEEQKDESEESEVEEKKPVKPPKKKRKSLETPKEVTKKIKTEFEDESPDKALGSLAEFRKQMKNETSFLDQSTSSDQEDVYQFSTAKPKKFSKGFEIFFQKIRPKLKATHKSMSDMDLKALADKLWNKMSSKQQLRYKSHKSNKEPVTEDLSKSVNSPDGSPSTRKSAMKIKIGKFGKFEASVSSSICKEDTSDEEVPLKVSRVNRIIEDSGTQSSAESITSLESSTDDQNGKRSKKGAKKSSIPSIQPYEDQIGNGNMVCIVCEKADENLIACKGSCDRLYHSLCIPSAEENDAYTCPECISGIRTCFICKEKSQDVVQCNLSHCKKYYHSKCLKDYPTNSIFEGNKSATCPVHSCLTCINSDFVSEVCKPKKAKLVQCVRCPTAYHKSSSCIGAGCSLITQSTMVCHNHFQPKKNNPQHSRVNVNWCFICSAGGSLICCETCPAAFHVDCLNIETPAGSFFCDGCVDHRQPRYGNIVWAKLGYYRWWPAVICNPKDLPKNIMALNHSIGEFPVKFFGSHDYFWLSKCRIFLFHEGDKGSKIQTQNHLNRLFNKAVAEATEAFKEWCSNIEEMQAELNEKIDLKPKFKHIKVNRQVGKIPSGGCAKEPAKCECNPNVEHPCGEYSSCINRMMMIECNPSVCPAGEQCENQRFEKRLYPDISPFRTDTTGWGLHCRENIKQGQFVIEYVGEIIDEKECKKRLKQMNIENNKKFYFLTLDKDRIIDAGPKGNHARFMNHCCQPNCETQKWTINGETRVGLFALHDIPAFTELNFNYNLLCLGDIKIKCMCGAPNCSGYIGVPPMALPNMQVKKPKIKAKKRKKKTPKVEHEDLCFHCGDCGDLVLCDRKTCTKCYHLECLNLKTLPSGKWDCPWHHCDTCGKPAVQLCQLCPSSFCRQHSVPEAIQPMTDDASKFICNSHEEFTGNGMLE